ncbi:FAD-dependent oxidoreductase [Micromonospora haikouensis]|uniref:FAD-dependent oxidoreductase n=1 Tax=Micromonospora haikouensis TaxID=686309 RepID=UPI00210CD922|nr:FAD-dependent oxidoreductase [Micromonospora haikouensis]
MAERMDVVVVGGGIIGLTAAVTLQERGARVTVLAADDPADTVSTVAAAVWYPTHTDEDPRVLRWASETHAELGRQAGAGVPGVVARRPGCCCATATVARRGGRRPPGTWWPGRPSRRTRRCCGSPRRRWR